MRKSITAVLLIAFLLALVSSHASPIDAKKHYSFSIVQKAELKALVDVFFLNDTFVPVVQLYPLKHIASVYFVAADHGPSERCMIRGPTVTYAKKVILTNKALRDNLC